MEVMPFEKGKLVELLQAYFAYLIKKIKPIIAFAILGIAIGLTYTFLKKPTYEAKLVFLLNDSKSVGMGNLSALAGQLGLGGQSSVSVSEDRVFYLAYSKRIIGGALLARNAQGETLGDRLIAIRKLKAAWGKDTILNRFESFTSKEIRNLSIVENKAMDQLIQLILLSKKYAVDSYKKKVASLVGSQNSGMMYVSFEFSDELFSKDFVQAIFNELSSFYEISAVKSLQNNYDLISSREDSLKQALQLVEDQMAATIDGNFQVNKFIGKVGENRLRRKLEILNLFYAEVIKNKEVAKFNLEQERPVFQIVDEPLLPLEAKYKSKVVYASLAGFGLLLLGIAYFTFLYVWQIWLNNKQLFNR